MVQVVSKELAEDRAGAAEKNFSRHRAIPRREEAEAATQDSDAAGRTRRFRRPEAAAARRRTSISTPSNLTENAKHGQDRSGARPRFRDPPGRRHPDAAAAEQPDPRRAKPASARRRWSKASRCASSRATCRRCCKNVTLRTLDLALLQAGAGVKGEFENRLKGLIEEVKNSPTPIILFIDEAHTMIGAGGAGGPGRCGEPAQAGAGARRTAHASPPPRGREYKKYFEKDPALARRFQVVKVEEPTEDVVHA